MSVSTSFDLTVKPLHNESPYKQCESPTLAIRIAFASNDHVWVGSDFAVLPGGASTIDAKIQKITGSGSTVNPLTSASTIGGASVAITDKNGSLSELIQQKLLNLKGTRKSVVEIYEGCQGEEIGDDNLVQTLLFYDYNYKAGTVTIDLKELIYSTKTEIFSAHTGRLYETIDAEQTTIRFTSDDSSPFPTFAHSDHYTVDPYFGPEGNPQSQSPTGQNISIEKFGYAQIEETGEEFSFTSVTNYGDYYEFNVYERGVFGTLAQAVEVEPDTEQDNRPLVSELIVFEETLAETLCFLWAGSSLNGNRTMPDHWCMQIDRDYIDVEQLIKLHENHVGPNVRAKVVGEETAKDVIEKQVLRLGPIGVRTDRWGRLSPFTLSAPTQDATYIFEFTPDSIVNIGELKTSQKNIYSPIVLEWAYNATSEVFRHKQVYTYVASELINKPTDEKTLQFKWLQPGAHTDAHISKLLEIFGAQYGHPTLHLQIKSLPSGRHLKIGDVVRVNVPQLRDSSSFIPNDVALKRSFLIVGKTYDYYTRQATYQLISYTKKPDPFSLVSGSSVLPDEHYTGNSFPGVSGGVYSGSYQISPDQIYTHNGALTLADGSILSLSSNGQRMRLHVMGHLSINGTIDLTGMGIHAGGAGQTQTTDAQPGEPGYFGSNRGGAGLDTNIVLTGGGDNPACVDMFKWAREYPNDKPGVTNGLYNSIPQPGLTLQNGVLSGMPADLSGSGGAGGAMSHYYRPNGPLGDCAEIDNYLDGAAGGRGGCGLEIICRGFSLGPNARIITNGGDASAVNSAIDPRDNTTYYGGAGAPGMPGCVIIYVDGNHTAPAITSYVEAYPGSTTSYITPHALPERYNMASECAIVAYIPNDVTPQELPKTSDDISSLKAQISELAATQYDGQFNTFIQNTIPGSSDTGDYWLDTIDPNNPIGKKYDGSAWIVINDPDRDSVLQAMIRHWESMSEAERAAALADGKIKTFITYSTDSNDWPEPDSIGDLLYVDPLSTILKTSDGLTWDQTFLKNIEMPTTNNMIVDPGFGEAALNGKKTWQNLDDGTYLLGDLSNQNQLDISHSYQSNAGEGSNSAGVFINAECLQDATYNPPWVRFETIATYQATMGQTLRGGIKAKILNLGAGGSGASVACGVVCYDVNNNELGEITLGNVGSASNDFQIDTLHREINDYSDTYKSIQYIRPFYKILPDGVIGVLTQAWVDFITVEFSERMHYYAQETSGTVPVNTLTLTNQLIETAVDCFDYDDIFDISWSLTLTASATRNVYVAIQLVNDVSLGGPRRNVAISHQLSSGDNETLGGSFEIKPQEVGSSKIKMWAIADGTGVAASDLALTVSVKRSGF